jgi:hypothetical protein
MGGAEGVGSTWAWSRFDGNVKASTAHSLRSVAWSYPVTPLAVFDPGCRFDRWDVIKATNAPNLVSLSSHAAHATACRHGHPRAGNKGAPWAAGTGGDGDGT